VQLIIDKLMELVLRVTMSDANCDDSSKHVQVSFAGVVEKPLHVAFVEEQRLFVVWQNTGHNVLLLDGLNFCIVGALEKNWLQQLKI